METTHMPDILEHNVYLEILERWYRFSKDVRDGEWFVVEDPRDSTMGSASAMYMNIDYRPIMSSRMAQKNCHELIYSDVICILVSTLIQ